MTYEDKTCVLVVSAVPYAGFVQSLTAIMKTVFKCVPEAGSAPPTKAERRAMKTAGGGKK